jgi:hypothetical protein
VITLRGWVGPVADAFGLVDEVAPSSLPVVVAGGVVGDDLGVDGAFVAHVPDDDQLALAIGMTARCWPRRFRDSPEPDGEVGSLWFELLAIPLDHG